MPSERTRSMIGTRSSSWMGSMTDPSQPEPELTRTERRAERQRLRTVRRERRRAAMRRANERKKSAKGKDRKKEKKG